MKTSTIVTLFSLAPVALSAQVCACGRDPATPATTSDAAVTAADVASVASDAGSAVQATQLLDDMRGAAMGARWPYPTDGPGTLGQWYTYSDRVVPWAVPPVFVSDAGALVPLEGLVFPPADDGAGPTYLGGVQPYRRCYGGGEEFWGAGFGMDFIDVAFDGGDLPVNDCDASRVWTGPVPVPFDASGWTGIQFWGKSLRGIAQNRGVAQQVGVLLLDDSTIPFGLPVGAGGCNSCVHGGVGACHDGFLVTATFPTDWTQIKVPFASMHPQGWSGSSVSALPNMSKLFALQFQIAITGNALLPFDVAVAYIELYK
jgi:hypothetical protein